MTKPLLRITFAKKKSLSTAAVTADSTIPAHFLCPISLELMKDPVSLPTGITYDRRSIETWVRMDHRRCPVTNQPISDEDPIPNHAIRRMIQEWCVANQFQGVERIPTPKITITAVQVLKMESELDSARRSFETARCREIVARFKALARESERNRKCLAANGVGLALCSSFNSCASSEEWVNEGLLKDTMSALTCFLPLDDRSCEQVGSPESLRSMVSILESGDLAAMSNTVLVLKEIVSRRTDRMQSVSETQGLVESIMKIAKEPVSPQTTKASILTIFFLVSNDDKAASRFMDHSLVPLLLELMVHSDKSMSEKALAVVDTLFSTDGGRQSAYQHALAVPVLVKKMLRVSDTATGLAVSALWKLCKSRRDCCIEALQVGGFQKLLLLLQLGCSQAVKEMATELLKLMNGYRGGVECIESADFKYLKRPF